MAVSGLAVISCIVLGHRATLDERNAAANLTDEASEHQRVKLRILNGAVYLATALVINTRITLTVITAILGRLIKLS